MNEMRTRVEELFHEVADLSVETRLRLFAERNIDDGTRREIEELLFFDSRSSNTLENDIGRVAERALARLHPQGLRCGPYRLGELLGRGGMGTVYSAERADGEVAQHVAIKLLLPGADDPLSRQRFLAERQILANLSHPNIAKLLDAGHREDGQPYLVMEYVEGKPIDTFTTGLGIRTKVALFIKVCAAVSYLHRNLVIHRDLKPSNVLVTDEGEPKLLDFGIAKILDLAPDATATCMRMLTPDYASPEQVAGRPITTATDIYSLGAVLYRLLTGTSPHQILSDVAGGAAIPSGRITPPSKLEPGVRGDLEFILLKALRPEPEQRYTTIDQFSEDLENYLASRPVRARKGNAWYRTQKFLRRYWLPATAITLALGGLSAGMLVANRQRMIAQRRFVQVRQLANKLFDIDAEVRKTPGTTRARELIVDTSLEYLRRLAADVHGDPDIAYELGNAYLRVARVQGVPIAANLGHTAPAAENLRIAKRFIDSVLASQPRNRLALLRAAQIAHDQMILARHDRRADEALALARLSAQSLKKFRARAADASEGPSILNTYVNVADQFMLAEQYDEALRLCREAREVARILNRMSYIGSSYFVSADVFRRQGDLESALGEIREAVRILDPGTGDAEQPQVMNFVLALINEGRILGEGTDLSMEKFEEAVRPLRRAFSISDNFVHRDPNDQNSRARLAIAGLVLANILNRSDARAALELYDHVLRHTGEIQGNLSFERYGVNALAGSSYSLLRLGRQDEGRRRIAAAFERLKQLKLYPAERIDASLEADQTLRASAYYEAAAGRDLRAIEIYQELLRKVLATEPKPETNLSDAFQLSRIYAALAGLEHHTPAPNAGAEFAHRRLDLWRHWNAKLPNNSFVRRQLNAASKPFAYAWHPVH